MGKGSLNLWTEIKRRSKSDPPGRDTSLFLWVFVESGSLNKIRRRRAEMYGFIEQKRMSEKRAYDSHIILFFLFYYEIYSIGILRKAGIQ